MNLLVNLNLLQNELQNAVIQPVASLPANGVLGQIVYLSTNNTLYQHDGTNWNPVGAVQSVAGKTGVVTLVKGDVGLGNVDNTSDATKKTNFTGTIGDSETGFVTGDAVYDALLLKLDLTGGTMSGNIAMGNNAITGLAAPTNNTDAATKKYVDDTISGLGALFDLKGTKSAVSELPLSGNKKGDVWLISADSSEYVWTSASSSGTSSDWEKFGVTVDLSGYLQKSGGTMTGAINMGGNAITNLAAPTNNTDAATKKYVDDAVGSISPVNSATGTIGTSSTSVTVNYSGTLINAYATQVINSVTEIIMCDIKPTSSSVTFTVAAAPSSAITCTVIYA